MVRKILACFVSLDGSMHSSIDFSHARFLRRLDRGSAATGLACAIASTQSEVLGISSSLLIVAYVASLATKLADTFASEIGKAYGKTTFLITTFKRVEPGTEGAVSLGEFSLCRANVTPSGSHSRPRSILSRWDVSFVRGDSSCSCGRVPSVHVCKCDWPY